MENASTTVCFALGSRPVGGLPPRANIFFSVAAAAAAAHSLEQERLLRVYHDGDDADISKGQVEWSGYCGLLFVRRDERMRVGPTYI